MKKVLIVVLAIALALTAFAGCAKEPVVKTGEAYGPVHGGGYVGYASVTVTDGKVTGAQLDEACYPSHILAGAEVPDADKVTVSIESKGKVTEKTYYKTVKFGDVTATVDTAIADYSVGGVAWKTWVQTEANAKKFYDAVVANKVSVVVGGADKTDIMTAKTLLKSLNGYGQPNFDWAKNQKATIDYVVKNGFDVASSLKNDATAKTWTDSNGVVATGATWSDMNTVKEGTLSYIKLLTNAYDKVKA